MRRTTGINTKTSIDIFDLFGNIRKWANFDTEKPKHMSGAKGTGKKVMLDMGAIHEDFFADTALIGIVSSLPAYRFCWLLNKHFGLDLVREPDLDICMPGEEGPQYFPIYQYAEPGSSFVYTIYKLKSNKEALLPEVRQLDYAWMIQSSDPEEDANNITKTLRDIPDIQLAQVLQADKLKSINNLIV